MGSLINSSLKKASFIWLWLLILTFTACSEESKKAHSTNVNFKIENAWIPLPPPISRTAVVYFDLTNLSNEPVNIIKIDSSVSQDAHIHTMIEKNNIVKMRKLDQLLIAKNQMVRLQPSGLHIMLIDVNKALSKNTNVTVSLFFDNQTTLDFTVPVKNR